MQVILGELSQHTLTLTLFTGWEAGLAKWSLLTYRDSFVLFDGTTTCGTAVLYQTALCKEKTQIKQNHNLGRQSRSSKVNPVVIFSHKDLIFCIWQLLAWLAEKPFFVDLFEPVVKSQAQVFLSSVHFVDLVFTWLLLLWSE